VSIGSGETALRVPAMRAALKLFGKSRRRNLLGSSSVEIPESLGLPPGGEPPLQLAVATVIRNERPYLREWLFFQKLVGAGLVLLYDNDSTDGFEDEIADLSRSGFVRIVPWPNFSTKVNFQSLAIAHAIALMRGRAKWLAILDVDEFLFSPVERDLPTLLSAYADLPALIVPWVSYGTSGHRTPPAGLVTENFITREASRDDVSNRYKSIVQPLRVHQVRGAHSCLTDLPKIVGFSEHRVARTLRDEETYGPFPVPVRLRINHYYSRSRQEFETKLATGWSRYKPDLVATKRQFLADIERHEVEDRSIDPLLPELKRLMAEHPG
jgi:hypothetical protein